VYSKKPQWSETVKYKPQNTLSYFLSAPQLQQIKLADIPIKELGAGQKAYRGTCGHASPDEEAIRFYTLNHLASVVKSKFTLNEPLPAWAVQIMQRYMVEVTAQSQRAFFYLLAICTREARHMYSNKVADAFFVQAEKEYGTPFMNFCKNLPGGEEEAMKAVENNPPDCTAGQYIAGLSYIFYKGKWASSFGGAKWGNVTDCLLHAVQGKTSMEMMIDTCYTLAHNGGPIFNKGMMYGHYTGQFTRILDIQRSGQMPELALDKDKYGILIVPEMAQLVKLAQTEVPDQFGTYVDWYKVQSMGAVGNYLSEQKQQDKKHPKKKEPVVFGLVEAEMVETGNTWDNGLGEEYEILERATVASA
jgi:hypothetical protein